MVRNVYLGPKDRVQASRMASVKFYLKIYSLSLGFVVSFASFCWMALILYVLSQTDPGSTGLMLARYLDISFGLLAFTSSLALLYGAFVESKVLNAEAIFSTERFREYHH